MNKKIWKFITNYSNFQIAYDSVNEGVLDDVREDYDEISKCNREKAKAKNKDD